MKNLILPIILFSSLTCTSLFGNPSIHFIKLEHDFGTIKQKTVVKESVKFKNEGNSTLIIEKIETSCGCTGTKVNKEKLQPNEEGILEISFNSGTNIGKTTKTIFIHTNISSNKTIIFKIKANVMK